MRERCRCKNIGPAVCQRRSPSAMRRQAREQNSPNPQQIRKHRDQRARDDRQTFHFVHDRRQEKNQTLVAAHDQEVNSDQEQRGGLAQSVQYSDTAGGRALTSLPSPILQ